MNTSQIFDPSRFAAVLRRDFIMQRNGWLMRVAAMLGVMILSELFVGYLATLVAYKDGHLNYLLAQKIALSFVCWFEVSLFTTLGASLFLSGWATPGERLNEIMSPASTLEKYASRFTISIIGVAAVTILCWELSDAVRQWLLSIFMNAESCSHVSFISGCRVITDKIGHTFVLSFLGSQAMYALGSTLFPRHPFLKTVGACFVIEMIFAFAVGFTVGFFHDASWVGTGTLDLNTWLPRFYMAGIVILTLFCFITAYFRIKEQEIIDRM